MQVLRIYRFSAASSFLFHKVEIIGAKIRAHASRKESEFLQREWYARKVNNLLVFVDAISVTVLTKTRGFSLPSALLYGTQMKMSHFHLWSIYSRRDNKYCPQKAMSAISALHAVGEFSFAGSISLRLEYRQKYFSFWAVFYFFLKNNIRFYKANGKTDRLYRWSATMFYILTW